MERRTFVKGAFGLTAMVVAAGAGVWSMQIATGDAARGKLVFTVPDGAADVAVGPALQAGIQLFEGADGIAGYIGDTQLFTVDETGAAIMSLADGSLDVDAIAREAGTMLGCSLATAEVASFFVTLGQAGYLREAFYANLVENRV